jgi:hypothetical protein
MWPASLERRAGAGRNPSNFPAVAAPASVADEAAVRDRELSGCRIQILRPPLDNTNDPKQQRPRSQEDWREASNRRAKEAIDWVRRDKEGFLKAHPAIDFRLRRPAKP